MESGRGSSAQVAVAAAHAARRPLYRARGYLLAETRLHEDEARELERGSLAETGLHDDDARKHADGRWRWSSVQAPREQMCSGSRRKAMDY
ncbi:unnamed protein product [Miscanthus lutarioriparius]|uniref:Uncharacterized protein n=1 Tax=Miscanthus lutarioriparius TaxID=422564 RepID=A0A811MIZ1_9POAL|nr:unnamed protein product [Miscanthus lutarioriparius]